MPLAFKIAILAAMIAAADWFVSQIIQAATDYGWENRMPGALISAALLVVFFVAVVVAFGAAAVGVIQL